MYYVIVNPASKTGKGGRLWNKAKEILREEGVEYRVYATSPERNATDITRVVLDKISGQIKLLVLGGDGTINEVIQAFHDEDFDRVLLHYLPTGSSNDLARDIGYDDSMEVNLRHLLNSNAHKMMDVGLLRYNATETPGYTKRYFLVSLGMGFDASVCYEALHSKLKVNLNKFGLGKLSYGLICIKQLFSAPKANVTVTMKDKPSVHFNNCYFVSVLNHRFQGGGFMFCPDAVDNDGILDICAASDISSFKILTILPTATKGGHVGQKGIFIDKTESVDIVSDVPLYVHTDGEVKVKATSVTVSCLPAKLKFVV